jgi:hypothetical protein
MREPSECLEEVHAASPPSWFRPLLIGNSPLSNSLIFKMNSGYNEGEQSAREVR